MKWKLPVEIAFFHRGEFIKNLLKKPTGTHVYRNDA